MTKTQLTKQEVLHLSKLANLHIDEEETNRYREQLVETLGYVENLEELDTSGLLATSSPASLENVFFEDGAKSERTFTAPEATKNSSNKKSSLFVVSRIL